MVKAYSVKTSTSIRSINNTLTSDFSLTSNDGGWLVHDEITPTIDTIEWLEEGECSQPLKRISDGRWYHVGCRFYQVKSEYIFAWFFESFNWTLVQQDLEAEERYYSSFDEFRDDVSDNPSWWLSYSYQVNAEVFGISLDHTTVLIDFNEETSQARVRIWCRFMNIPSFFIMSVWGANRRLEPIFAGFDFSDVHFGSFETLEWNEFYNREHGQYKVRLKTPADLLSVYGVDYTFTLLSRENYLSTAEREIKISMPSDTQVLRVSPGQMANATDNTVIFTVNEGQMYPSIFSVTSGPPIKEFSQVFLENITSWVTDPSYWVVFGSLIAIVYGAFSGKRMWSRRKTYYRLYRSMIRVYDHYSNDVSKFDEELDNLSKAITQYFIEGKINDNQFDRLLSRRDDLIDRVYKTQ